MGVLGTYLDQGWFYSRLFSGKGWWGVNYCWNRCSSNFSFQNNFVIVLPWGHQGDNNAFSKVCIFKVLLATPMMVVMKPKAYVVIIIKSKAMKSLLWLV
jgi:hypothetical protein